MEFKVNKDVFRGKPFLAAQTMIDFTLKVDRLGEDTSAEEGFKVMTESLELVLMPDSYARFIARMRDPSGPNTEPAEVVLLRLKNSVEAMISQDAARKIALTEVLAALQPQEPSEADPDNPPIELPQVNEILEWIMGEYGMRPPTSAEGSSLGSSAPASGTNSTESASDVVSISSASRPISS